MKKNMIKILAILLCFTMIAVVNVYAQTITTNQTGTDGLWYSFWTDGQGSVSMDLNGGGSYSMNWTNCGDFVCGKGWNPGTGRTVNFSGSFYCSGGGAFGIYGWTLNPRIEYYIVEKTGAQGGPVDLTDLTKTTQMGTVISDGSIYTIYKHYMTIPDLTYLQYINIRQSQRTSGTITIQNHLNAWQNLGMNLGTMNYQILLTEGVNGSGNSSCTVSEAGNPTPAPTRPIGPTATPTPTPGGTTIKKECESMTRGGMYARLISTPFSGVALYANNDNVSYTQNFSTSVNSFSLRGCSNNSNTARVNLQIGGQTKGTFYLGGSSPAVYTLNNISHGTGNQTVKLVVTADNGQWDAYVDYLEIK